MSIPKEVVIKCSGAATLPIDKIIPFQGDFKELTKDNFNKLKNTILTEGFCSPGSVWENDGKYYAIDCHQRLLVLKALRADGYLVPDIPVDFVYAKDKEEAKKLILTFSSNYGTISEESLSNFMIDAGLSVDFLDTSVVLPEVSMDYYIKEETSQDVSDEEYSGGGETITTCPECGHQF